MYVNFLVLYTDHVYLCLTLDFSIVKKKKKKLEKSLFHTTTVITYSGKNYQWGFPGGTVVKNPPANAGGTGSSPGLGRSHMPQSN